MKTAIIILAGGLSMGLGGLDARAQEGLATSAGIQGHNTIQQAPSGGRVNGAARSSTTNNEGFSTDEERRFEKHNNAVSQICKGC